MGLRWTGLGSTDAMHIHTHRDRYQMVKSEVVKEYGAKVTLYKHRKTGAEIMSVSVDDDNKVGLCCGVGIGLGLVGVLSVSRRYYLLLLLTDQPNASMAGVRHHLPHAARRLDGCAAHPRALGPLRLPQVPRQGPWRLIALVWGGVWGRVTISLTDACVHLSLPRQPKPSQEPFVDLLKGSLQTFLNAFTYPDRTCA